MSKKSGFRKIHSKLSGLAADGCRAILTSDHPLMKALSESFAEIKGVNQSLKQVPGARMAAFYQMLEIRPLLYLVQEYRTAHDANEHIVLEEMFLASEIIALTLLKWCEVSEEQTTEEK